MQHHEAVSESQSNNPYKLFHFYEVSFDSKAHIFLDHFHDNLNWHITLCLMYCAPEKAFVTGLTLWTRVLQVHAADGKKRTHDPFNIFTAQANMSLRLFTLY